MRIILSLLVPVILLGNSFSVSPASAQSAAVIEQLHIALWPEFDRPAVLVMYKVQLKEDTPLPAWVSLPMPASAGEPHAVAWRNPDGRLLVADYERAVEGEWANIKLVAMSFRIQFEYYQDLDITGSNRNFEFRWPGGYQVNALSYEVQQPVGVSQFKVGPAPTRTAQGGDGLTYLSAELGSLAKENTFTIDLSYLKTSNQLSADTIVTPQLSPSSPSVQREGSTQGSSRAFTVFTVVLIVGLLVFAGLLFYTQYRRKKDASTSRPDSGKKGKGKAKGKKDKTGNGSMFCHNCGKRASPRDHYCRYCGAQFNR
jgi:hypothetical protein